MPTFLSVRLAFLPLAALLALGACTAPMSTSGPPGTATPASDSAAISAADPRAAAAGAEILRAGGNATDAAIATLLALNVVEPQNSGIGGGGFWLAAKPDGTMLSIDGRETAPAAARADWFTGADGKPVSGDRLMTGGKATGVPGAVAMMARAHEKTGRLAWKALFAPAIRLARDGFTVTPRLHNGLSLYGRHVTGWARETYFPGGAPVAVGSHLTVPALAETLERIASDGPARFYDAASAGRIATTVSGAKASPAPMVAADVTGYAAIDREPLCGRYRVYRVCTMAPPGGGIVILTILQQLERFDMRGLGRGSPVAWHLMADSQRLAYADRNTWLADPAFTKVPVAGLLAPGYIASRSALIAPDRMLAAIAPGKPAGAPAANRAPFKDDPGTSSLSVADPDGNVVAVTNTINGYFGSGLAVDGYMLNNELPDFDATPVKDGNLVANRVEGGKRPRSSMAPTIVYGPDGEVRLVIGAAGGATIICQIAKAIVGVVDWDLSAQEAIAMGLIFAPGTRTATIEEGSELVALVPQLRAMGEDVKVAPLGLKANAVELVGGRWRGGADPRSEGVVVDMAGTPAPIERRVNELNGAHE